jgi:hypothetical protein
MDEEPWVENLLQSIQGPAPAWTVVPAAQLVTDPYRNLCQIRTPSTRGSGWLSADGRVYTAAHVVHPGGPCEIRLAGGGGWIAAQSVHIHREYEDANGNGRKGSPADLARIHLPAGAHALPGLQVDSYQAGPVSAKGFSGETLVQHSGNALRWDAYVCHSADTERGHSGCPVLVGNRVVAIHVGPMSLVRPFFAAQSAQTNPFLNGAVRFGPAQLAGLAAQP